MPENTALIENAISLCLTTLNPSACASIGSCPLACRDQADCRAGEAEQNYGADHQKNEPVPVVGGCAQGEHVRNRHANFATSNTREDNDRILEQEDGH